MPAAGSPKCRYPGRSGAAVVDGWESAVVFDYETEIAWDDVLGQKLQQRGEAGWRLVAFQPGERPHPTVPMWRLVWERPAPQ